MNGGHLGRLLRIELSDARLLFFFSSFSGEKNFFSLSVTFKSPLYPRSSVSSMANERFKEILTGRAS